PDRTEFWHPTGRLAGGLRLSTAQPSSHEVRFTLLDRSGRVVRAWRVTSQTQVAFASRALTPALVGSDLCGLARLRAAGEHEDLPVGAPRRAPRGLRREPEARRARRAGRVGSGREHGNDGVARRA